LVFIAVLLTSFAKMLEGGYTFIPLSPTHPPHPLWYSFLVFIAVLLTSFAKMLVGGYTFIPLSPTHPPHPMCASMLTI
jgi:hypothetical protein